MLTRWMPEYAQVRRLDSTDLANISGDSVREKQEDVASRCHVEIIPILPPHSGASLLCGVLRHDRGRQKSSLLCERTMITIFSLVPLSKEFFLTTRFPVVSCSGSKVAEEASRTSMVLKHSREVGDKNKDVTTLEWNREGTLLATGKQRTTAGLRSTMRWQLLDGMRTTISISTL